MKASKAMRKSMAVEDDLPAPEAAQWNARVLVNHVASATVACESVFKASAAQLKAVPVSKLQALVTAANELGPKLQLALRKATPCPFGRQTVDAAIDRFAHYRFRQYTGLCNHNLSPLLDNQVKVALDGDRPTLALEMLAPILSFFNDFQGQLDDSGGFSGDFLNDWCDCAERALHMLNNDTVDKPCGAICAELEDLARAFTSYPHERLADTAAALEEKAEPDGEGEEGEE